MPPQRKPARAHDCPHCTRTFERSDHLARHIDAHRNERPFQCTYPLCERRFNRRDVLRRHLLAHASGSPAKHQRDRAAKACAQCAAMKLACDNNRPCHRCQRKGVTCTTRATGHSRRSVNIAGVVSPSFSPNGVPESPDTQQPGMSDDPAAIHQNGALAPREPIIHDSRVEYLTPHSSDDTNNMALDQWHHDLNSPIDQESQNWDHDFTPGPQTSDFSQEFSPVNFQARDLLSSMNDLDSLILNDSLFVDNIMLDLDAIFDPPGGVLAVESNETAKSAKDRAEAFERSLWLWVPQKNQTAFSGESSLPLGDNDTERRISSSHSTPLEALQFTGKLSDQGRDGIFELFLRTAGSKIPVSSFPNVNSLDALIKIGIAKRTETDAWIHPYTVYMQPTRPELLTGLVAAGCVCSCLPSINKTGVLLLEVVRVGLSNLFESDNSVLRDLAYLQASMIWLDIGIFCGYKRKMQIAESFFQPLCTSLRRAGAFDRRFYRTITLPTAQQDGKLLESVWLQWVQQESFKRLVYHLYEHDTEAAMAMDRPALTTFGEFTVPLPAPRELWMAGSATEWRDLWTANYTNTQWPSSSLRDLMADPSLLSRLCHGVDVQVAQSSLLHGLGIQMSEFRRQSLGSQNRAVASLWIQARQDDLYTSMQNVMASLLRSSPASALLANLSCMGLHVGMDSIQRLAGRLGDTAAEEEHTRLGDWFVSQDARRAIWHAGQVFRSARGFLPYRLRGFDCLAIYHASLTLWVYALFHYRDGLSGGVQNPRLVYLNGEENEDVKAFVRGNSGTPGLVVHGDNGQHTFHSLKVSSCPLEVGGHLLQGNYQGNKNLPPLVNNLLDLLRELGNLP